MTSEDDADDTWRDYRRRANTVEAALIELQVTYGQDTSGLPASTSQRRPEELPRPNRYEHGKEVK